MNILIELVQLFGDKYLEDTFALVEACSQGNFTSRISTLRLSAMMCNSAELDKRSPI